MMTYFPVVLFSGSLASLGSLPVFARQSFNQPTAGTAAKMSLSGEFSDVSVDLPAGAWPASDPAGQLSIMVFELPSSFQRRHVVKAGTQPLSLFGQQEIAGKAVYFGPEGVKVTPQVESMCACVSVCLSACER